MAGLVVAHLRDDCPAARIILRQAIEMRTQVLFHLPFGFAEESQIPAIAGQAGDCGI